MKKLSYWINTLNDTFWIRIASSTYQNLRSVCVFRIITGLFLLLIYFQTYSWIGESPQAFFQPPFLSFVVFMSGFPSKEFFIIIDVLSLLSVICIILGIKAKTSTIIYVILNIIGMNFRYSFGKLGHAILPYVMLICMSFSGWGRYLALVPDKVKEKDNPNKSLALMGYLLCFAFFSAGIEKSFNWINFDFNRSGVASWFYPAHYNFNNTYLLAHIGEGLPFWVMKIMDYITILLELSPLFFLLKSKKYWYIWLLIAAIFHIANTVYLNIPFLMNSIVYLTFCDFSWLFDKLKQLLTKPLFKIIIGIVLLLIFSSRVYGIFNYSLSSIIFISDSSFGTYLYIALAVWILTIAILFVNTIRKPGELFKESI